MNKGKLIVVSGPSGAGKSTITKMILEKVDNLFLSTSATTRKPRIGEIDKKDYFFMTVEEFKKEIDNNNFLENANVHGNFYGTLKSEVLKNIELGKNIILEIDVQGGEQVKEKYKDAILVFIKAPNNEELERRLRGRKTDSEQIIQKRLENSLKEMEYEKRYNYVIINETLEQAIQDLKEIIFDK